MRWTKLINGEWRSKGSLDKDNEYFYEDTDGEYRYTGETVDYLASLENQINDKTRNQIIESLDFGNADEEFNREYTVKRFTRFTKFINGVWRSVGFAECQAFVHDENYCDYGIIIDYLAAIEDIIYNKAGGF